MMSPLFIDYVHEKGDVCFNPELPPVFDDEVNGFFSPSNGAQSLAASYAPMEKHSNSTHVLRSIEEAVKDVSKSIIEDTIRDLIIIHDVTFITEVSPFLLLFNQRLHRYLSLELDHFLTVFNGEECWISRKTQRWVNLSNFLFYCVPYSDFEMDFKGGKIHDFFSPHCHYYMLRLMISLDGGLYLFIWRDDMLRLNMYNLSKEVKWFCFTDVGCLGLACLRFDELSMLLLSPKLLMTVLSKFRISYGLEMDQVIPPCLNSDILILGSNVDIRHHAKVKSKEVELMCFKVYCSLVFGCDVLDVVVITSRRFLMVFDPGGKELHLSLK